MSTKRNLVCYMKRSVSRRLKREELKAKGFCVRCKKPKNKGATGMECSECRRKESVRRKRLYAEKKKEKKCVTCGETLPSGYEMSRCTSCADKYCHWQVCYERRKRDMPEPTSERSIRCKFCGQSVRRHRKCRSCEALIHDRHYDCLCRSPECLNIYTMDAGNGLCIVCTEKVGWLNEKAAELV